MPSAHTSSRSSWRGSSRRRWTSTARSRSRASTCRTSTPSTCRRPTASSSTGYEGSLIGELQDYLAEHARRESYALLTPPKVLMLDRRRSRDRRVRDRDADGAARGQARPGAGRARCAGRARRDDDLQGEGASSRPRPLPPRSSGSSDEAYSLTMNGRKHAVDERRVVLGRSKDCDVQVEDANVSRRHAELRQEGASYWLVDLDSTNGTEVNGKRVQRVKLADGDTITLGATELVFAGGAASEHRGRRGAARSSRSASSSCSTSSSGGSCAARAATSAAARRRRA